MDFMDPKILHISRIWLPLTHTWLFNLISQSQMQMPNVSVVCELRENIEYFSIKNLYSFDNQNALLRRIDQKIRKIGFRKHLHFYVKTGRALKADIIHSHFGNEGWKDMGVPHKVKAKHVVTFYGRDVNCLPSSNPKWVDRYSQLFKKTDIVLCEGPFMAASLIKLGCPAEKVVIQRIGINLSEFPFIPRKFDIDKPIRILIAASFREKKGIPYAISAVGMASQHYNVELTIIGDAPDSDVEKKKIMQVLQVNSLFKKTKLLGYLSHDAMIKESYNHHVFIQSSITASDGDTEGGAPVSIIEMMATGMPVISSYHCDIPDIIPAEFHHCLLAPERDAEALFNCIKFLVEHHGDVGNIVFKLREHVESRHNVVLQASRLKAIYQELL
ncbi:MAG: glycosyltransferase [Chlorobium sp.]|uniref:glycosyltransferase n=1 Tax=Chlorobium sp. TaxID=1095 RepID=UPI002F3E82F7